MHQALEVLLHRYELRVGGALEVLLQRARGGEPGLEGRLRLPTLRQAAAAQEVIASLRLKPKKARARDFARLEEAVAQLEDILEA